MKRPAARTVAILLATSLIAGVVVGLLWLQLAPRPELVARSGRLVDAVSYPQAYVAADAMLGLLCAVTGLLLGILGLWRWFPASPDTALLGLTAGSVIGPVVAWRIGTSLGSSPESISAGAIVDGTVVSGPLQLQAVGVLLFWPAWVAVVGVVIGLARRSRRPCADDHQPEPQVTAAPTVEPS